MGCCGPSSGKKNSQNENNAEKNLSPLDLLKLRLARGEITFEEYEKIKPELVVQ
ncbi:hypothetical protein LSG31_01025 [Fodinisporobacter ferrooxydans]|uniref:SHOCT domain-containing protein n=1 Tax=Fodinisporobacter ferrooxydans TaxID=2901836 RepID=A0ABY4CMZ0_9BACL|nr:hypothetical protein LSG31_01025 [Alicyclobacillaceae bacterium MYW30-H2]